MNRFAYFPTTLLLPMVGASVVAEGPTQSPTVRIDRGEPSVVFRDNSLSPGLLSGIDSLFNVKHAPNYDA